VPQTRDKHARIQALFVRVENGAFLLQGEGGVVDPSQQALLDEMLSFPQGKTRRPARRVRFRNRLSARHARTAHLWLMPGGAP
jgi:hypothetical protein